MSASRSEERAPATRAAAVAALCVGLWSLAGSMQQAARIRALEDEVTAQARELSDIREWTHGSEKRTRSLETHAIQRTDEAIRLDNIAPVWTYCDGGPLRLGGGR